MVMCCFSGPVQRVKDTSILVRRTGDRQLVVYEMKLAADTPVAMILPLHVAPGGGEEALRFIDLGAHAELFDQLNAAFAARYLSRGPAPQGLRPASLRVQQVGAFEASYVPGLADFDRLDPRFRIDDSVWRRLPGYRDAGFAVFQLRAGEQRIHPMAFEYAARWPEMLHFPTVHVHDGALPDRADFDHSLYFQGFDTCELAGQRFGAQTESLDARASQVDGECSGVPAGAFVRGPLAAQLVDLEAPLFRLQLKGSMRNDDFWVISDDAEPRLARTDRRVSAWAPV